MDKLKWAVSYFDSESCDPEGTEVTMPWSVWVCGVSSSSRYPSLSSQKPVSARALVPSAVDYWPICAYNTSKLCNLLFMKQLNERYSSQGVFCNAVHPGNLISTSLGRHSFLFGALCALAWPFTRSPVSARLGYWGGRPPWEALWATHMT